MSAGASSAAASRPAGGGSPPAATPGLVVVVGGVELAHLARALDTHARWCRTNGVPFPAGLVQLRDAASTGPERTNNDAPQDPAHDAPVPLLVDATDAARALDLSERQLRRLVRDGDLKAVHIGRSVRFAPDDLAEFVDRRRSENQ